MFVIFRILAYNTNDRKIKCLSFFRFLPIINNRKSAYLICARGVPEIPDNVIFFQSKNVKVAASFLPLCNGFGLCFSFFNYYCYLLIIAGFKLSFECL